jgi:hypothetical protein
MEPWAAVTIWRDDKWQTVDIAELSDQELLRHFEKMNSHELLRWVVKLAGCVRGFVKGEEQYNEG